MNKSYFKNIMLFQSIFKNLNLRRKANRKFAEKPFQAPKIIFKSSKLIGQKSLSHGHLLKYKTLKFTFLRGPTFRVLLRGSFSTKEDLNPRKQVFKTLARPETKNLVYFLWETVYIRKFCSLKGKSF